MNAPARVVIATRKSPLALWQAEHVRELLSNRYPGLQIELLGMTTLGDRILDRPLSQEGGKGLFVKELELALLESRAHLAVHSLKDVPMQLDTAFALSAVLRREDPRDCMVSSRYATLEEMPAGARIGTSSLRRELMLRARFPQLVIGSIRGNLGTRLAKLDNGEFDALVLAAAGLKRLGFSRRIRQIISTDVSLPAPGQGALGIEVKSSDEETTALLSPLDDPITRAATSAERAVSRGLGGSCQVPLAAY
ncbi:MAG TPA: hydroxymethylbilane synthase, partial [Burkholderiaceae bacterium]|nr:hydroxymethylbilane synthase [Burkholderiaceae bacterium]